MLFMSTWRKLLILVICAAGIVLAAPNMFYSSVEAQNDAIALAEKEGTAPPEGEFWPSFLPSKLVNLGLDLRGGVHLLVKVKLEDVYNERYDIFWSDARDVLREKRDQFGNIRRLEDDGEGLRIAIENSSETDAALSELATLNTPVQSVSAAGQNSYLITREGDNIRVVMSDAEKAVVDERTMARSLEITRRRIDAAGTREPSIQRQGDDRILIEVPGFGSSEDVLALLGKTAKLTFHPVIGQTTNGNERVTAGELLLPSIDEEGIFYKLDRAAVVSGDMLTDAHLTYDQNNNPAVGFRFNPTGARKFGDYTASHIGDLFAIVLDNEVISAPQIQAYIGGGSGIITGSFTVEEAQNLSVLLRSGALPAEIEVLEQNVIGPDLGQDSIDAGRMAAMIALLLVLVYMATAYKTFGMLSDISLLMNIVLIIAGLSLSGLTLTLPGIAGIVLTIGMAVDANVLIYERIKEELKVTKSVPKSINIGYDKALSAITDANVTTLMAAVILYWLGAGPVRGFAVTLMIGIVTSVFTAVFFNRLLVTFYINRRRPKQILQ